jgi:chromate transport protein ChrA/rhodanese-related sulfurtransferase
MEFPVDTDNASEFPKSHLRDLAARLGLSDAPLLLDVRPQARFRPQFRSCWPAPCAVPLKTWPPLPQTHALCEVVVYCVYGHEVSTSAAVTLRSAGWPALKLAGGMQGGEDGVDAPEDIARWRAVVLPTQPKTGGSPVTVQQPRTSIPFGEAFRFWLKLGFISFGGPAGQIAIMHRELVEQRRWISEKRFLHALNYCMLLPGPEAQQLATYIGWLMHRTWGGVVAGVLFVLPSLFILIGLSWVYLAFGDVPLVAGLFYGIKPAVAAIVAACRVAHRQQDAQKPAPHTAAVGRGACQLCSDCCAEDRVPLGGAGRRRDGLAGRALGAWAVCGRRRACRRCCQLRPRAD